MIVYYTQWVNRKILPIVFEKQKVNRLLQVITYWLDDNEYRIDFLLWQNDNG